MTVTASALNPGATLTDSSAAVVTAGSGTSVVTQAVIINPTSAAVTVDVTLTRSGGASVTLIPGRVLGANTTDIPAELAGLTLSKGDVLSASGAGAEIVVSGYILT